MEGLFNIAQIFPGAVATRTHARTHWKTIIMDTRESAKRSKGKHLIEFIFFTNGCAPFACFRARPGTDWADRRRRRRDGHGRGAAQMPTTTERTTDADDDDGRTIISQKYFSRRAPPETNTYEFHSTRNAPLLNCVAPPPR